MFETSAVSFVPRVRVRVSALEFGSQSCDRKLLPPPVSTCPLRGFFFTDSETEEDLMGNCDGVWVVQIPR